MDATDCKWVDISELLVLFASHVVVAYFTIGRKYVLNWYGCNGLQVG